MPWPVTAATIAALAGWLGPHFYQAYRRREANMTAPVPPAPDPADRPASEPLMTRAAAVAVAGAVLGLLVSLHVVRLSDAQTEAVLTVAGIVLPLAAAWWGRRHVWSPRQVARVVAQTRADLVADLRARRAQATPGQLMSWPVGTAVPPLAPPLGGGQTTTWSSTDTP